MSAIVVSFYPQIVRRSQLFLLRSGGGIDYVLMGLTDVNSLMEPHRRAEP